MKLRPKNKKKFSAKSSESADEPMSIIERINARAKLAAEQGGNVAPGEFKRRYKGDIPILINKSRVKRHALNISQDLKNGQFTRVSAGFMKTINEGLSDLIEKEVLSATKGKTL